MRILFIHKYNYHEPLGIMSLSAFLKEKGHHCEFIDLKFDRDYISCIKKIKPDIIAYSIISNTWQFYQKLNLEIKAKFNVFSVFGGPHTTFFPDFIKNEGVDAICVGEGEYAILDLANALEKNEDITRIQNLWIKKENEIFKNTPRRLIDDLDSLPFADRDLINIYNHYRNRSRVRLITSRGCPYNCSYCFNHSYRELYKDNGKMFRQRSVENVISELRLLKKMYNPRNIEFHDDVFIIDKFWIKEFLIQYKSEIDVPFDINVRVDLVTPEIMRQIKDAGCKCVHFGIEAGNPEIRNKLLNRNISNEQIINAAQLFKKEKLKTKPFNIVGLPGETVENVIETIMLNHKCKVTYAINTIYHPYPRTQLALYAQENGYYDGNPANLDKSLFYGKSAIKSPDIKKIIRLHYFFPFCVKMPFLIPLAKILIRLPLNKIYQSLFFLYRAYSVIFIYKQLSIREIFIFESKKKQ